MKKICVVLYKLVLVMSLVFVFPFQVFAADSLLSNLKYDPSTHILSGKTAPYADIYLSDSAGRISADENGNFQFPIPDGTQKATVTVLDSIGNTSTEIEYNFTEATTATTVPASQTSAASPGATTTTAPVVQNSTTQPAQGTATSEQISSATSATKDSSSAASETTRQKATDTEKEKKSSFSWFYILLALLLIAIAGSLLFFRKKKNKKRRKHTRKK